MIDQTEQCLLVEERLKTLVEERLKTLGEEPLKTLGEERSERVQDLSVK